MAKTKVKDMDVSLWICHTAECPGCYEVNLIRGEDPIEGDTITCAACGRPLKVGSICGDFRSDKKPRELSVEHI